MGTNQTINVSNSARSVDSGYSEVIPSANLGPEDIAGFNRQAAGEAIDQSGSNSNATIVDWSVMATCTQGLKSALTAFVDVTKEGIRVPTDTMNGRQKVLVFDFFGNATKSAFPGEIGQFKFTISYPPMIASNTGDGSGISA